MLLKQESPFKLEGNVVCSSQPVLNLCSVIPRGEISAFTKQLHFPSCQWNLNDRTKCFWLYFYLGITTKWTFFTLNYHKAEFLWRFSIFNTFCYFSTWGLFSPSHKNTDLWKRLSIYHRKTWRIPGKLYSFLCLTNIQNIWPLIEIHFLPQPRDPVSKDLPSKELPQVCCASASKTKHTQQWQLQEVSAYCTHWLAAQQGQRKTSHGAPPQKLTKKIAAALF